MLRSDVGLGDENVFPTPGLLAGSTKEASMYTRIVLLVELETT